MEGGEFTGNMGGVTIKYRAITSNDLTWVIEDNDLSVESGGFSGWVIFRVGGDVSSFDIFNGKTFDVETNIVSRDGFF